MSFTLLGGASGSTRQLYSLPPMGGDNRGVGAQRFDCSAVACARAARMPTRVVFYGPSSRAAAHRKHTISYLLFGQRREPG